MPRVEAGAQVEKLIDLIKHLPAPDYLRKHRYISLPRATHLVLSGCIRRLVKFKE